MSRQSDPDPGQKAPHEAAAKAGASRVLAELLRDRDRLLDSIDLRQYDKDLCRKLTMVDEAIRRLRCFDEIST